jgi:hypothetical protein
VVWVFVDSDIVELDGTRSELKQVSTGEGGGSQRPRITVKWYGLPEGGATLLLEAPIGKPVRVHVVERSYDLPTIPGFEIKARGAGYQAARSLGDGTITYRSFNL